MKFTLSLLAITMAALAIHRTALAADIAFPLDSGVINVKEHHGAKGDGKSDDTAALQAAIVAALKSPSRYYGQPIVYLPRGTYLVTNMLEGRVGTAGFSLGWLAGLNLIGAGREATVLRVPDGSPNFADPLKPLPVFRTGTENTKEQDGGGNAQAFRHGLQHLTIDVGKGNPGANGLSWLVHNRGILRDVTIRAGEGSGVSGLEMGRAWPGPGLVKDLIVEGFDVGISMRKHYQFSMTFENVTLSGQRKFGFDVDKNVLRVRKLKSSLSVPAVRMESEHSHLVLMDSELTAPAGTTAPAITGAGAMLVRNTSVSGYAVAWDDTGKKTNADVPVVGGKHQFAEFTTNPVNATQPDAAPAPPLEVEDAPDHWQADVSKWVSVARHGATTSQPDDDDAPGIQAAIDAGGETVYFPAGDYHLRSPVIVRGKVKHLLGCRAGLWPPPAPKLKKGEKPPPTESILAGGKGMLLLQITGDSPAGVVLENLRCGAVEHSGSASVTFRSCDAGTYQAKPADAAKPGKLFIEDCIGPHPLHLAKGQKAWARQFNSEFGKETYVVNDGADLWIFGMKTEGSSAPLLHQKAGRTEIWGGFFYPQEGRAAEDMPMLLLEGGSIAASYRIGSHQIKGKTANYPLQLLDRTGAAPAEIRDKALRGANSAALLRGGKE